MPCWKTAFQFDLHAEPIGNRLPVRAGPGLLAGAAVVSSTFVQQLVGGPLLLVEPGSTRAEVLEHRLRRTGLYPAPRMGKREHCSIGAGRRPAALRWRFLPEQLAAADAHTGLVCTRCPIRDAAMTRRHVVAWHKGKIPHGLLCGGTSPRFWKRREEVESSEFFDVLGEYQRAHIVRPTFVFIARSNHMGLHHAVWKTLPFLQTLQIICRDDARLTGVKIIVFPF